MACLFGFSHDFVVSMGGFGGGGGGGDGGGLALREMLTPTSPVEVREIYYSSESSEKMSSMVW